MQSAYLRAYSKLEQFEGRATFGSWVTRIVVNEALAHRRERVRQEALAVASVAMAEVLPLQRAGEDPEVEAGRVQLRKAIERAIEQLPDGTREVLVLRDIEELSTAETAASLDISEPAVRVRLHRARTQLRQHLEREIGLAHRDVWAFAGERCDRIVAAVLRGLRS